MEQNIRGKARRHQREANRQKEGGVNVQNKGWEPPFGAWLGCVCLSVHKQTILPFV